MIFNIKSFHFLTDEDIHKLKRINLISEYLDTKEKEINETRESLENADLVLNGQQLTNIGVFRNTLKII